MAHWHMSSHISPPGQRNLSSLDLELGEGLGWDDEEFDEFDMMDGDLIQEEEIQLAQAAQHNEPEEEARPPPIQFTKKNPPPRKLTIREKLNRFDPQEPPKSDDLEEMQLWLECNAHRESVLKYQKVVDDAIRRQDFSSMTMFQKQVIQWYPRLKNQIAQIQNDFFQITKGQNKRTPPIKSLKRYGPFLCTLAPEKMAVIAAHETLLLCLLKPGKKGYPGVPFLAVASRLGHAVEQEVLVHRMLHKRSMEQRERAKQRVRASKDAVTDLLETDGVTAEDEGATAEEANAPENKPESEQLDVDVDGAPTNWTYASSHLNGYLEELSRNDVSVKKRRVIEYAIRKARSVFDKAAWSDADRVGLGSILFQCLLENAYSKVDGKDTPAFTYEKRWLGKTKCQSYVFLNDIMLNRFLHHEIGSVSSMATQYKPMIMPPKPWKNTQEGGYMFLKSELMRYHGCKMQEDALEIADMSTLHQGLNVLGQVPWKINKRILEVAWQCWEKDIALGDIPTCVDFEVPPEPIAPPPFPADIDKESPAFQQMIEELRSYREALFKYRRIRQKNMDLRSLRCSAMLKLNQAEQFKDFEKIYFPYVSRLFREWRGLLSMSVLLTFGLFFFL